MSSFLLDVNVLIALLDAEHTHHEAANDWFADHHARGWATCPITQNGAVRIMGNRRYPASPGPPSEIARVLGKLCRRPEHQFWPDSISIVNSEHLILAQLDHRADVTDTYLLALARANGGRLATFDRQIEVAAVLAGINSLHIIR